MTPPTFFKPARELSLAEIVALTGARPRDYVRRELLVRNIATFDLGGPNEIVWANDADEQDFDNCQAGACLVSSEFASLVPASTISLISERPYDAFLQVANALFSHGVRPSSLFELEGTSPSSFVHPTARVEPKVDIDPGAMIGPRVEIGAGSVIGPMSVIGPDVRIGRDCSIGAGCSLTRALLGDRVIIQPGARVGTEDTLVSGTNSKAPSVGRVILQDGVQVGANCTIDAGFYADTVVGEGTVIDSLVHVASGIRIGHCCVVTRRMSSSQSQSISAQRAFPDHAIIDPQAASAIATKSQVGNG